MTQSLAPKRLNGNFWEKYFANLSAIRKTHIAMYTGLQSMFSKDFKRNIKLETDNGTLTGD